MTASPTRWESRGSACSTGWTDATTRPRAARSTARRWQPERSSPADALFEHTLLHADQLDELELHLVPAMLGQGSPVVRPPAAKPIELVLVRQLAMPQVTHPRYRVRR
jgi:hypothetical protein